MPHISVTLYPGKTEEQKEKIAKALQSSLHELWGPEAVSVSMREVAPEEFEDYIHGRLEGEKLLFTSDFVK